MDRKKLEKILFSHESMFCVSYGNQGFRVWRMKQEAFDKECLELSVKFTASVMVWGCMTAKGPGNCDHTSMTASARIILLATVKAISKYRKVVEHPKTVGNSPVCCSSPN